MKEFEIRFRRLHDRPFTPDAVHRHVDGLRRLDDEDRLIAAGPLADGSGGLVLARFDSLEDAHAYAHGDPFVVDGYESVEVREWLWATGPTITSIRPVETHQVGIANGA